MALFRFIGVLLLSLGGFAASAAPLSAERYFVPPGNGGTVLAVDADVRHWVAECDEPNCLQLCNAEKRQRLQLSLSFVQGVVFVDDTPVVWGCDADGHMKLLAVPMTTFEPSCCPSVSDWVKPLAVIQRAGQRGIVIQTAAQPSPTAPLQFLPLLNGRWGEPELLHQPQQGEVAWCFDRRGSMVALLRWLTDGSKEIAVPQQHAWKTIYRVAAGESLNLLGCSGESLYFLHDDSSEFSQISAWRADTQCMETICPNLRGDVCGTLFSSMGELLGISTLWDREQYNALQEQPAVAAFLKAAGDNTAVPQLVSADGERVVGSIRCESGYAYKALYDSVGGHLMPLEAPPPAVPLYPVRFAEYTASDRTPIPVYYTLPAGWGPFPTILFLHGGPRMRTVPGFDPRVQYLVNCGFAVVQPQFRGSRGWGRSFMQSGYGQWGRGVMQTDVDDCVPWLMQQGIAEAGNIAVFGGSYGGYAAVAALCFSPCHYACGISLFGPHDLVSMVSHADALNTAYLGEERLTVGDVDTVAGRKALREASTLFNVGKIQAPLFLYYGEKDELVPPAEHSAALAAAMRRAGKTLELHTDAAEAHGFSTPAKEAQLYEKIVPFLRRCMEHPRN